LTALLPLRKVSPRNLWPTRGFVRFSPFNALLRARTVLCPYRRSPRETAGVAPPYRLVRPLRRRARLTSDIPCRAGHRRSKPLRVPRPLRGRGRLSNALSSAARMPNARADRLRPPVKEAGPGQPGLPFAAGRSRVRRFLQIENDSRAHRESNGPEVGPTEVSLEQPALAATPLSRPHRPASFGPGGRSQRFAAPHPHRDMPSGITPTPSWPCAPVALP